MAIKIYNFIVLLSASIAGLLVVIGGILIVISGGPGGKNEVTGVVIANSYSRGKEMIIGAAVGMLLILSAYVIIHVVMMALGYSGTWSAF